MAIATGTAILGAAALGAGAGLLGSSSAANASEKATDKTLAVQNQQYQQTRADLAPYAQAGQAGLTALQDRATGGGGVYGDTTNPNAYADPGYTAPAAFKFTEGDYQESDAYKFQLARGLDAIQSSQATRGAMYSGATAKAIAKFSQGLAAQEFSKERDFAQNAYTDQRNFGRANYLDDRNYGTNQYQDQRDYLTNRYDQQTGVASNLAGIGQNAAAGQANAGQNYANSASNAYAANASNIGNAALSNASNFSSLLGSATNAYAYGQGQTNAAPGVVNSLASGGAVPRTSAMPYNNRTYAY